MSKMSELDLSIRDMLEEGYNPVSISVRLGIPVHFVYDILEDDQYGEELSPFNTVNS
jgi:hypothetical protein